MRFDEASNLDPKPQTWIPKTKETGVAFPLWIEVGKKAAVCGKTDASVLKRNQTTWWATLPTKG